MFIHCECEQLPRIFNYERFSSNLKDRLADVDARTEDWLKLCVCRVCGQNWQLDVWDKHQINCALKIDAPECWQTFDDKPFRLQLLVDSRGGFSEKICVMAGCRNRALKSLAYCPEHAFGIGLRE